MGPAAGGPRRTGRATCRSRCRPRRRWWPTAVRMRRRRWSASTGSAARRAFDDRNRKVARALVTCLDAAGVRFAMLGQEESCTGDPARRMGNEYVFQLLAPANVATLRPLPLRRTIVTACPHCFNTIGNEYGQFGGHFEVDPPHGLPGAASWRRAASPPEVGADRASLYATTTRATWPATTAISREPRAALRPLPGMELREMEQRGRQSFCCGAGGGRMWMEETSRHAHQRRAHAAGAGDRRGRRRHRVPVLPAMMRDGLAEAGDQGAGVEALDIAEVLAAGLAPAQRCTDLQVRSGAAARPARDRRRRRTWLSCHARVLPARPRPRRRRSTRPGPPCRRSTAPRR